MLNFRHTFSILKVPAQKNLGNICPTVPCINDVEEKAVENIVWEAEK